MSQCCAGNSSKWANFRGPRDAEQPVQPCPIYAETCRNMNEYFSVYKYLQSAYAEICRVYADTCKKYKQINAF